MKDKKQLQKQIIEDLQLLIGMTPSGPERNRICDINIAMVSLDVPDRPVELPEFDAKELGDWAEVNQHQFMDGSGFSYHLAVPGQTPLIVICKDKLGKPLILRPVKNLIEYLNFKHEPVVKA